MSKDLPRREAKKPRTRPRGGWCPDTSAVTVSERKYLRCPTCGRRLLVTPIVRSQPDGTQEQVGFRIPEHKTSSVK